MSAPATDRVLGIHFRPPLAIARVGGSDTPLEGFTWTYDRTTYGAHRTVIRPTVTFEVRADGSLRPYVPVSIQFRDRGLLRPVAPFFELWASVQSGANGEVDERPLTTGLLRRLGASTDAVAYTITVANRKAQRRAGSAACAYIAAASASASDWQRKALLAFSPHEPGEEPLVAQDRPIPLGYFQAIKPGANASAELDLSILRVRFTPARGNVYGPPEAVTAPASPLEPGEDAPPAALAGRLHQIVPPENRILNGNSAWSHYAMNRPLQMDPAPSDSYDGANVGSNLSWGVVDDTCDGIIEAQLVVDGRRFTAAARVLSTCPDFAPDRRPFYSLADDLQDRDLSDPPDGSLESMQHEVADFFKRISEAASVINLDATRYKLICENLSQDLPENRNSPQVDFRSLTGKDQPYADLAPALVPDETAAGSPQDWLRFADVARLAHGKLASFDTLMEFLVTRRDHVLRLLRPPFGRFRQLKSKSSARQNRLFRDPRNYRDTFHDMRMPPYMRDSDENPLSMTWRQYETLLTVMDLLTGIPRSKAAAGLRPRPRHQPGRKRRA
jgi:hypothetical protein